MDALNQAFEVYFQRVQNANEFRDALQRQPFDLVVADWEMPRFSAVEALKISQEFDPNLPFIIVSGTMDDSMAVGAMELGAHDYVMKDNLARLHVAVARELHQAKIRRNLKRHA